MPKIIIISNDICAIKQIINTIDKQKKLTSSSIKIYDINDFKNHLLSHRQDENAIYFIDIYDIEHELLDILKTLNLKNTRNKIIILNNNSHLKSLLESQKDIYAYLEKDLNFQKRLSNILSMLSNNETTKIHISDLTIPTVINQQDIEEIYQWPNKQLSINYKTSNNNILCSVDNVSNDIKQITKNSFYTDKQTINKTPRKNFSETIKHLIVDLYLIHHVDYNELSKYFNVEPSYIKKWASLSKYNSKMNIFNFIAGKLIIKLYFNQHKGR